MTRITLDKEDFAILVEWWTIPVPWLNTEISLEDVSLADMAKSVDYALDIKASTKEEWNI